MTLSGLAEKVALVTGANNPMGIGAATAKALAREGASVFITYWRVPAEREIVFGQEAPEQTDTPLDEMKPGWAMYSALRMKTADEVLEAIRRDGGRAAAWEADLTDAANIPLLFDNVEAEFGPVDVLVNNAAHAGAADQVEELTAETFDRTYAVNTRATLLLTAEYVRRYKRSGKRWGRIVNLSTGPAQCFTDQITYGSSKAAIEAATRAAAVALGALGITVNAVAPGPIQTGYITERSEAELVAATPLRRIGQPEDIANAIVFLCSDEAGYVSGQVLRVTGGRDL
jgi:3-oxoacyl-[acyl-carrier protein] reductase